MTFVRYIIYEFTSILYIKEKSKRKERERREGIRSKRKFSELNCEKLLDKSSGLWYNTIKLRKGGLQRKRITTTFGLLKIMAGLTTLTLAMVMKIESLSYMLILI